MYVKKEKRVRSHLFMYVKYYVHTKKPPWGDFFNQ